MVSPFCFDLLSSAAPVNGGQRTGGFILIYPSVIIDFQSGENRFDLYATIRIVENFPLRKTRFLILRQQLLTAYYYKIKQNTLRTVISYQHCEN